MSTLEAIVFAGRALSGHRRRTLLALAGVAVGIASVVVLTALGEGARRYVVDQFTSLGTNLLVVFPGKTETRGGLPGMFGGTNDLTLEDARAVGLRVPGVRRLAPVCVGNETVSWRGRRRQVAVLGSTAELIGIRNLELESGRFLPPGPMDRGAPVAVLGTTLARELFQGKHSIGEVLRIGDWRVRVIGVLASQGMHMGIDMDDMAVVPVATGMRMFDRSSLFRILVEAYPVAHRDGVRKDILATLVARHGEEDVTVWTQDAVIESLSSILRVLSAALVGIAAISLAVAGIGIMNVMLVSVSERTREIGLLCAVGARRSQILQVFLTEAVLLSAAGGAAGIAVGTLAALGIRQSFPGFSAAPPAWAIAAAASVAIGVGALFGLLPSWKAMRLEPVAALARR